MRRLLPKSPPNSGHMVDGSAPSVERHRRHQVSVACQACRRRKTKCDERRPQCTPCVRFKTECHVPVPKSRAKRDSEVSQGAHLRGILDLLRRGSIEESNELLDKMRRAPSIDDFVESFAASGGLPRVPVRTGVAGESSHSNRLSRSLSPSLEPWTVPDALAARFPAGVLPVAGWTALSADNLYLTHLLNLFFAWDNALSRVIHRTMFLRELGSGESVRFCSRFLVHCIIAVAHLYLSQGSSPSQLKDIRSRGRTFANEALGILQRDRAPSIPLAQGLALLWMYEANFGDQARAAALLDEYYRVHEALGASEVDVQDGSDAEWQAVSFVSWGFFCFEVKIALALSREMRIKKPRLPKTFVDAYSSTFADPEALESSWSPYPGAGRPQPSRFREVVSYECQLAELAWDASCFFSSSGPDTALPDLQAVRAVYERLLAWNTGSTQRFLLNSRLLPSVVFLDATFEMILLQLLACLARFPSTHAQAASALSSCAASLVSNLWVYRAAHGPRHEYLLQHACSSAAAALLPSLPTMPGLAKVMVTACQLLHAMGGYLPAANRSLWRIRGLARLRGVAMPEACRVLLSGAAVRMGKVVVRGVGLVDLGAGGDGGLAGSHEVAFSSLIEGIRCLSVEN